MATILEKTARLEVARKKVEAFVAAGGDLKSKEAVPVGLELVNALADLAEDFGYEILKPIKKPGDFIRPDPASRR
ncbi:MAG TPA: hypothetical protein VMU53_05910 [Candidatus Sulfotelmatobacter sp.]|nr:hypothetical protein [Candidatus Sulfotelmatobacter sp.]